MLRGKQLGGIGRARLTGAVWIAAVGVGLVLPSGCGSGDAVVARARTWSVTCSQLSAEYDRINGEGSFARLDRSRRERFLEAVVDKEILLVEAARAIPALSARSERRVRVRTEEQLITDYRDWLWARWRPDSLRFHQGLERLSREARGRAIIVRKQETGDSCHAALQAGLPFEQAWLRYDARRPDASQMDIPWWDPLRFPPRITRAVFLQDLAPGAYTPAIHTRRGVWILQVLEFRPFDLSSIPGYHRRALGFLKKGLYRDDTVAHEDSLRRAVGFQFHPEACSAIGRAVSGYIDSVTAALAPGDPIDEFNLRAPLWRLSTEERRIPAYTLAGQVMTAEDFVRSLDDVAAQYWPRSKSERALAGECQVLLDRLLAQRDAHARGRDRSPAYLSAIQRIRADALLDEYEEQVLQKELSVTPAEVDSLYQADPGRWKIPERIEFAAVLFPEDDEETARQFADSMRGADAQQWTDAAERAREASDDVQFIPSSDLMDVGRIPDPPSWAPLLTAAEGLQIGEVAGPIRAREAGGCAVVRLLERIPARPLGPGPAHVMAEREVRLLKVEARLREILTAARQGQGVRVWPDRLGSLPAEEGGS